MDKITIGFIGGCLNNQKGIKREDLYYSILSKILSSEKTEYQISLRNYLSYDQLPDQAKILINKKNPDMIFLFIRPFPLMPLQKLIVKYEAGNNKVGYALHPALFNRKLRWNDKLTAHQSSSDFKLKKRSVFGLRDINLLAGVLFGLHHWMLKYLTNQLDLINQRCKAEDLRLYIISPPRDTGSLTAKLLFRHTLHYLEIYCKKVHLDLLEIHSLTTEYFEEDKVHFNVSGHRKLAEMIYDTLTHL
jgi:hypothetical protein